MIVLGEEDTRDGLEWRPLIDKIADVLREGCDCPVRTAHNIPVPGEPDINLLMMPAWQGGKHIVIKLANIVPGNATRDLPAVAASVLVFDGVTGAPRAMIEGGELTARRTAAASALAADHLARRDASRLLIVGTGRIATNLVQAHAAIRDYQTISIWGRSFEKAQALAKQLSAVAPIVEAVSDIEPAARAADVIACATLATDPLIRGAWLKPGTHLDLVGAFRPDMREADTEAMTRADVIVVDTYDGALAEAGDIIQPLDEKSLDRSAVAADLRELCCGAHPGRTGAHEITIFKSVGAALEDYAAAALLVEGRG